MKRSARAFWEGFGDEVGTNPEELIAAAHAGCFSMGLAWVLGERRLSPERIRTTAELSLRKGEEGWTLTGIHLVVRARVAGVAEAEFRELAERAKATCLVSRLVNIPVTLSASLE